MEPLPFLRPTKVKLHVYPNPNPSWTSVNAMRQGTTLVQHLEHAYENMYAQCQIRRCMSAAVPVSRAPTRVHAVLLNEKIFRKPERAKAALLRDMESFWIYLNCCNMLLWYRTDDLHLLVSGR